METFQELYGKKFTKEDKLIKIKEGLSTIPELEVFLMKYPLMDILETGLYVMENKDRKEMNGKFKKVIDILYKTYDLGQTLS
jgi:hypothetical protein